MAPLLCTVHLIGFAACVFVAALLFAQDTRAPGNRELRVLLLVGALWTLLDLVRYYPIAHGGELAVARFAGVFRILAPFALFDFACAFGRVRRKALWIVLAAGTAAAVAAFAFTDAGVAETAGRYRALFDALGALSIACAAWVTFRAHAAAREPALRKALLAVAVGVIVAVALAAAADIALDTQLGRDLSVSSSVGFTLFIPFVGFAILGHGFLEEDIAKAAVGLFADARDGIVILDRYDRIRQMNAAAIEMLRAQPGEILGAKAVDAIPVWPALVAGAKAEMECPSASGLGRRLALTASSPVRRGRRFGRFVLVSDVTDTALAKETLARSREALELEAVRRSAELEVAQRTESMGSLIGCIAHDFNNLLAAILGFATAARDDLPERHAIRRDLDEILAAARKARDTVLQLLAFGRLGKARRKPVEVGELLETSLSFVEASLPVSITLERPAPGEKMTVMGDATQLHQVIINLTTNAAQAIGGRKGTISVSARKVALGAEAGTARRAMDPAASVVLSVRDDGPGIAREHLDRIFDPFFTTKPKSGGSGLGLPLAQRIAKDHGGAISVESEEGKGATFSVYLPLIATPEGAEAQEVPAETGSERILLVDADPASSRKLRRTLVSLGYRVTSHGDPRAAVEAYARTPGAFDAAIVDMDLAGSSGLAVAARLLEERPNAAILLLAGRLDAELSRAARRLHVTTVAEKPIATGVLAATVRRMLDAADRPSQPSAL